MKKATIGMAGILVVVGLLASFAAAETEYASVPGGSEENMLPWEDTSTWVDGLIPVEGDTDGYFKIVDNSYVTMYSTTYNNRYRQETADCYIWGTLYLGTDVTEPELKISSINIDNSEGKTGTLILVDTDATIHNALGGSGTLNVEIGESSDLFLGISGTIGSGTTVTIDPSGRLFTYSLGGTVNLDGGQMIYYSPDTTLIENMHINLWTATGSLVIRDSMRTNDMTLASKFSGADQADIYLSSTSETEVGKLILANTTGTGQTWNFDTTGGVMRFDARDDIDQSSCDQMVLESSLDTLTNSSDVTVLLLGNYGGVDNPQDFVGNVYQLFDVASGDYSGITPIVPESIEWVLNAQPYNIVFIDTLSTDGKLTIASVTPVPEPVTTGLLTLGAIAILKRSRRK